MNMRNFRTILVTLAFFGLSMNVTFAQHPPLGGGTGTAGDPYQITTAAHLAELATYVNAGNGRSGTIGKYYKLMNDIDLSGYATDAGWNPIGNYNTAPNTATTFCGNFDGNGKVVQNLTISRPNQDYVGLFGVLNNDTIMIKNIRLKDCNVIGAKYTGSLVGKAAAANISNCHVTTGTVTGAGAETSCTGGLVGQSYYAKIRECHADCNVIGVQATGGLVGQNTHSAIITDCYATGNVNGMRFTGGLVGQNDTTFAGYPTTTITNCYATGNVSGVFATGGLVGDNRNPSEEISCCYATGNVIGEGDITGGLVGWNHAGAIVKNCVAINNSVIRTTTGSTTINRVLGNNTGISLSNYACNHMTVQHNGVDVPVTNATPAAGTGKDTLTFKQTTFYTTQANWTDMVWNFAVVWNICPDVTYPWLRWENIDCWGFVAVINITNLPSVAIAGTPLTLSGTVIPSDATNRTISWSIVDTGTTGATITGNIFNATAAGTATVKATIANGAAEGIPFTKNFDITVSPNDNGIADITAKKITVYPNPTTGELRVTSYELQMGDIVIFDVMGRNVGAGFARPATGEAIIDISHLPAGVYYLRIGGETAKVMKQ